MGLFDKLRKNTKIQENVEDKDKISSDEAIKLAKRILEIDQIYMLLSTRNANMIKGVSIPYVCQLENNSKGILLFSNENYAREYIEKHHFEILDGVYPIGVVDKTDKVNGLHTILGTANVAKVDFLDFNAGFNDNSFGCSISWFMEVNKLSNEMSMLLSKDELDKLMMENSRNIPIRFNPIKILDFDNKYILDRDSSKAILQNVFEGGSFEEQFSIFSKESLFECCHTMDYLYTQMIPMAEKNNKVEDVKYFKAVGKTLEIVIKGKLSEAKQLYTLADTETNKIIIKNDVVYIIYTDRYKYMGQYKYIPLEARVII
jgi:hypothetical protein